MLKSKLLHRYQRQIVMVCEIHTLRDDFADRADTVVYQSAIMSLLITGGESIVVCVASR